MKQIGSVIFILISVLAFVCCGNDSNASSESIARFAVSHGFDGDYYETNASCDLADSQILAARTGLLIHFARNNIKTYPADSCTIAYNITDLTENHISSKFYKAERACVDLETRLLDFMNGTYSLSNSILRVGLGGSDCKTLIRKS
ncbi:MAG: hypothetical protein JWQ35_292 [Bacteriovoracaceae bacterium]|nr:hypothetical protein [Bacteriovoracaceae bacterium]